MKQSRRASFIESWANIFIGFGIQYVASWTFLNHVLGVPFTHSQNVYLGIFMTVVSLIRSFALRRAFEHFRVKGILQ